MGTFGSRSYPEGNAIRPSRGPSMTRNEGVRGSIPPVDTPSRPDNRSHSRCRYTYGRFTSPSSAVRSTVWLALIGTPSLFTLQ